MHDTRHADDMARWLRDLRLHFVRTAPNLLETFDIYAAESLFGRRYIANDIAKLHTDASILEVGAGSLLLSCQLIREGYAVTALEPTGSGFSHFEQMRAVVLSNAREGNCCPPIVDLPAEQFSAPNQFDYAFSVNVMEHVDDVAGVIRRVGENLKLGGTYRFTCPNYLFPYEPHFNIPTLFSKRLTATVLKRRIFNSETVLDAAGTWKSLNWITVLQIARYVGRLPGLSISFNRNMLFSTLERVVTDSSFASRRSRLMSSILTAAVKLRIHYFFKLAPAWSQPIIDCSIRKIAERKAS